MAPPPFLYTLLIMDLSDFLMTASDFLAAYLAWLVVVSRLVLSPIAKYPGPKLAALSNWYGFYYEVVQQGRFTAHIQTLHDRYGILCPPPPPPDAKSGHGELVRETWAAHHCLAWMALTMDIITDYAFARSYDHLDSPGLQETMHESLVALNSMAKLAMLFPIVFPILDMLPDIFIRRFKPDIMPTVALRRDLADEIRSIRKDIADQDHKSRLHPTVFNDLLLSDQLGPSQHAR